MSMTKRLGRGLADIIGEPEAVQGQLVMLGVEQLKPGKTQPRWTFSEEALEELKRSIQQKGVIEPVIVRPDAHGAYELVAGERRWRAATALGMKEIPAIVRMFSDREALECSLVENVQRESLNPLEEAKAYARLSEEFGYTQEQVSETVGKDRATVANMIRLLRLPEEIQQALGRGETTMGHAKILLGAEPRERQLALYQEAAKRKFSVRQLEALAASWGPSRRRRAKQDDPSLKQVEDSLRQALGTKVTLHARKKGGRITIEFFSNDDLTRILGVLGASA